MEKLPIDRVKWPYATHLVDRSRARGILGPIEETRPGALMLARVATIGRHREIEDAHGRRMALFPGDVFVGVLAHRYATDQFEAIARCSGPTGHIVGIGGVCGEVVSMNTRMTEPTTIEWLGRLADQSGEPLTTRSFSIPEPARSSAGEPVTILSLGTSMNSGKTTTAAQMVRSLVTAGFRVAAAKITGTACCKDPNFIADAGATPVLDFTHTGWPSTAGCSREELLAIAAQIRRSLAAEGPDYVVFEIADGIVQRETALLLEDPGFRDSVDAVTFAASDALACEAGVRRLSEMGYRVLATGGIVANGRLGIAEAERTSGIPCLSGAAILEGALVPRLRELRSSREGMNGGAPARVVPPVFAFPATEPPRVSAWEILPNRQRGRSCPA